MEPDELYSNFQKTDPCFYDLPPVSFQLIVGCNSNSLQYAVFDPDKHKFVAFTIKYIQAVRDKYTYYDQIKNFISENELLSLPYKNVRIIYETQQSTLVPDALFDIAEAGTYLRYNQQLLPDDVILTDKLRNNETANIFCVPAGFQDAINLPNSTIHHHASVFIESLLLQNKNNIVPQMVFVQVHAAFFDIMVLENRRLKFYNTFAYKTAEDFMYFVLLVFGQLKMSPEQTGVTLMGEIVKISALYELLYKYIRNLQFVKAGEMFASSHILNNVSPHLFYSLFNTVLCEL